MAAAIAATALGIIALGSGGLLAARAVSEAKRRSDQQYDLVSMQGRRLAAHRERWAEDCLNDLHTFLRALRPDESEVRRLAQREAVACMSDFDATPGWSTKDYGAYYLAFDKRNRLLMGGVFSKNQRWQPNLGARLYDGESPTGPQDLGVVGMGPVGFTADGLPIQLLLSDDGATVTLTNLAEHKPIRRWELPGGIARDDHEDVVAAAGNDPGRQLDRMRGAERYAWQYSAYCDRVE